MNFRPHMATKVRSKKIMGAPKRLPYPPPCTLRIASFIGLSCSESDTVVMAHPPIWGKGISTKVSDLEAMLCCATCHRLLDQPSRNETKALWKYEAAIMERLLNAGAETRSILIDLGIILITDGRIIK